MLKIPPLPDDMYEHINDFWEEQAKAEENSEPNALSFG